MLEGDLEITYPALPVAARRDDILAAMRDHQVVVVVGETGSGKTTQLPKMALELAQDLGLKGKVACTQPRRIAASSVSKRVAEELKVPLGREVGYKVRFTDETSKETRLKFMTDGILLAETQGDPDLREYHTVVIDEAHERSLNIDFLLGLLRNLLDRRKDLRVIISSATLDAGGFQAFYSEGRDKEVPLLEIEGRTFPVETHYLPEEKNEDLTSHVARAVEWISSVDRQGDILVFLPGEREIRECADVLDGRSYGCTDVLPLYARLGMAEQQRIFQPSGNTRRIVLATNVAETSLTIPGIIYVVDSGIARVSRYSPGRQVQRLQIEAISQASARQRKGRCGRVTEGICVRLYDEEDFEARPEFTDPEIRRSSLAGVILRMKSLALPDIENFPLVDPPSPRLISEGYRTLREIGAMTKEHELTEVGWQLSRLPVDPRLGRMLLHSRQECCTAEVIVLVAALSLMDPRERPQEKKDEADRAQQMFQHVESDFLSLLKVWSAVQSCREGRRLKKGPLRKLCRERFLNFRRVVEWDNLVIEISRSVKELLDWKLRFVPEKEQSWAHPDAIHKSILAGAPRQFGQWKSEKKLYVAAGGREFAIFPGSGLFGSRKQPWLLAMELVETSRLWARRVSKLDPLWVEEVAPHLCALRYHSAKWDKGQGVVYAEEIVMSGGLELARRRVHFGRVDVAAARDIFIREGLLQGGLTKTPKCLKELAWLKEEVNGVEQKLRRPGGLWSDELVVAFFEEKIPRDICTAKAFQKWNRTHEDTICPRLEDVVYEDHAVQALGGFPDTLSFQGVELSVYYMTAPGERDDGVTLGVHVDQLPHLPVWLPDWGVSGNLAERVRLLIRRLPKPLRTKCNPAAEVAAAFAEQWADREPDRCLRTELADYLTRHAGLQVGSGDIALDQLPPELVTKIWVCDDDGGELAMGTDLTVLQAQLGVVMKERLEEAANEEWEQSGMLRWECGDLPESIKGATGCGYPALVDDGRSVGVRVFAEKEEALQSHRAGCVRLLMLEQSGQVAFVEKNLPLGWDAKMFLPTTGATVVDLVRVAVELTMASARGGALPRDEKTFLMVAETVRADLFQYAQQLTRSLEGWLTEWRAVQEWVDANRSDRNLGEVAEDIEECLGWLMRQNFAWRAGANYLPEYSRYFQALQERIDRVESLPLGKELEKLDLVREFWEPWQRAWAGDPNDVGLWEAGWLLQEYRVSLFAPNVRVRGKVSAKAVRKALEQAGI